MSVHRRKSSTRDSRAQEKSRFLVTVRRATIRPKPVADMISVSVDDLRSSLRCAREHGGAGRTTLTMARDLAESLGYRGKVRILEAELSRMAEESAEVGTRRAEREAGHAEAQRTRRAE